MKNTCFLFFCLLLYSAWGLGQNKVAFGLQGSLPVSWFKLNSTEKYVNPEGMKIGYGFGLILDYNFAEHYSFSTGLNIKSNIGSKLLFLDSSFIVIQDTIPKGTIISYGIQYVEIPASLKLKTNEIGYMTYFGQFGFTPQVLYKAKGNADQGGISDADFKKEVRFFGIALNVGAGFHYSLGGNTYVLVALIYDNGLLDVTRNYKRYSNYFLKSEEVKDKILLHSLSLKVGIMF